MPSAHIYSGGITRQAKKYKARRQEKYVDSMRRSDYSYAFRVWKAYFQARTG